MLNKKDRWIIFVTGGLWQLQGIKEAKKIGLKILVIDSDKNALGKYYSNLFINANLTDETKILLKLKNLNLKFDGVVSYCSEAGMWLAAKIRFKFNLPGPSIKTTHMLTDKAKQRYQFSKSFFYNPVWEVFKTKKQLYNKLIKYNKTKIIKPCDSSGSRGVYKIEKNFSPKKINSMIEKVFKFSKSKRVIVEDYMPGEEFSVEVFLIKGKLNLIAITKKNKINNNTVSQEIFTIKLTKLIKKKIFKVINAAYAAINYKEGPGHAEIIIFNDKIGIVEIAGRGPGFDMFDVFLPICSGINLPKITIMQSIGLDISNFKSKDNENCHIYFYPSKKGKLLKITGLPAKLNVKGRSIKLFVKKIQLYKNPTTDGDRFGYVLAYGKSSLENKEIINKYRNKINFKMY